MSARNASAALANHRVWHHIDASGFIIGRLATAIIPLLLGKHKPVYHPAADLGDYLVVTNAAKMHFSGRREKSKRYYWHTGYPGGLRMVTSSGVRTGLERIKGVPGEGPAQLLYRAVSGMLPRNDLRWKRLDRLKVFNGPENEYQSNMLKTYRK